MDRTRKSEKPEPPHQPIEPEMPKTPEHEHGAGDPAVEPAKDKRTDEL